MSVTLSSYTRVEMNPDPPFFQTFRSIKRLRCCGTLPFKVQTHENGKSMVDTVDWKIQLLLFVVYVTLNCGFWFCCLYIVLIRSDMDFFQFFSKGFRPLGGANLTLAQRLDDNMEMIFTLLSIFVGGVMQIGLNYQRQNICQAYGFFTNNYHHCPVAWQKYRGKMSHLSIIFLMVNFFFLATLAVAIALQFMKNLECIIVEFIWIHILDKCL